MCHCCGGRCLECERETLIGYRCYCLRKTYWEFGDEFSLGPSTYIHEKGQTDCRSGTLEAHLVDMRIRTAQPANIHYHSANFPLCPSEVELSPHTPLRRISSGPIWGIGTSFMAKLRGWYQSVTSCANRSWAPVYSAEACHLLSGGASAGRG